MQQPDLIKCLRDRKFRFNFLNDEYQSLTILGDYEHSEKFDRLCWKELKIEILKGGGEEKIREPPFAGSAYSPISPAQFPEENPYPKQDQMEFYNYINNYMTMDPIGMTIDMKPIKSMSVDRISLGEITTFYKFNQVVKYLKKIVRQRVYFTP